MQHERHPEKRKARDIKLIHDIGKADMNSVAETRKPAIPEDIARRIQKLIIAARQGQAVCDMMLLDNTVENSEPETIMYATRGLSDTLERIGDELQKIWSE
jgi:hypothetical protein